jgi:hypothetical protein
VPGIRVVHDVRLPPGRGLLFNTLLPTAYRTRALGSLRPLLTLLEFADD